MATTLRDLCREFPDTPDNILIAAAEDETFREHIRTRDHLVVVYEVVHELSAYVMTHPGFSQCTLDALGRRLANHEEQAEAVLFNGKVVRYKLVVTLKLLYFPTT